MTAERQREIIRSLKGLSGSSGEFAAGVIPICSEQGERLGTLEPITQAMADDEELASALTRWRNNFAHCFFTQFKATPERTRNWLHNVVLKDDSRLLFLIHTPEGRLVGNFGICHVTPKIVEMDNLIRGETGGAKLLIHYSYLALLHWLIRTLEITQFYGRVFSDNAKSLRMHERMGFRTVFACGLTRSEPRGEIHFTPDPASAPIPGEVNCIRMELTAAELLENHPWLQTVHG